MHVSERKNSFFWRSFRENFLYWNENTQKIIIKFNFRRISIISKVSVINQTTKIFTNPVPINKSSNQRQSSAERQLLLLAEPNLVTGVGYYENRKCKTVLRRNFTKFKLKSCFTLSMFPDKIKINFVRQVVPFYQITRKSFFFQIYLNFDRNFLLKFIRK